MDVKVAFQNGAQMPKPTPMSHHLDELSKTKSQHILHLQEIGKAKSQHASLMQEIGKPKSQRQMMMQEVGRGKSQKNPMPINHAGQLQSAMSTTSIHSNTSDESKRINPHNRGYQLKKMESKKHMESIAAYSAIIKSGGQLIPTEVTALEREAAEKKKKEDSMMRSSMVQTAPSPMEILIVTGTAADGTAASTVARESKLMASPSIPIRDVGEYTRESTAEIGKRRTVMTSYSAMSAKTTTDPSKWNDPGFAAKKKNAGKQLSNFNLLATRMKSSKTLGEESALAGLESAMNEPHWNTPGYRRESDYFALDLDGIQDDQVPESSRVSTYANPTILSYNELDYGPALDPISEQSDDVPVEKGGKRKLLADVKTEILYQEIARAYADFEERVMYKQRALMLEKVFLSWKLLKFCKMVEKSKEVPHKKPAELKKALSKKEPSSKKLFTFQFLDKEPRIQPRLMRKKPPPPPQQKPPSPQKKALSPPPKVSFNLPNTTTQSAPSTPTNSKQTTPESPVSASETPQNQSPQQQNHIRNQKTSGATSSSSVTTIASTENDETNHAKSNDNGAMKTMKSKVAEDAAAAARTKSGKYTNLASSHSQRLKLANKPLNFAASDAEILKKEREKSVFEFDFADPSSLSALEDIREEESRQSLGSTMDGKSWGLWKGRSSARGVERTSDSSKSPHLQNNSFSSRSRMNEDRSHAASSVSVNDSSQGNPNSSRTIGYDTYPPADAPEKKKSSIFSTIVRLASPLRGQPSRKGTA